MAKTKRPEVMIIDQTKRGTRSIVNPSLRMLKIVVMKLIEAATEEAPAR